MPERDPRRSDMTGRVVRARKPRRPVPTAPTPSTIDEAPPQLRAPNRTDWRGPLDEDERAALEAGWGFIE